MAYVDESPVLNRDNESPARATDHRNSGQSDQRAGDFQAEVRGGARPWYGEVKGAAGADGVNSVAILAGLATASGRL